MKNVLLVGGCGFLGSHLLDRLLLRDDLNALVVVDNLWTGTIANISHIDDPRLHFIECDIETFDSEIQFDEVIHFGSPASPPWYMQEPIRTIKANVHGALNILKLIKKDGKFCFASTSEVYGDPLISPQPESYRGSVDCTGPRSAYDEAKRCTESILFESRRTTGLDIRVIRLFNVYGPRTRLDDGRAVSNFIGQALTTGELTVYGDGTQTRSWGYVDDIIDALERYFWRDESVVHPGPVNIGNDREVPVLEIAQFIAQEISGSKVIFAPPIPQDPTNRCPDLTRCREILPGWEARVPFEEGIRRTIDWFKEEIARGRAIPLAPAAVRL